MNKWLNRLEEESKNIQLEDVVLWPGSVIRDMQPTIVSMQGAGDTENTPISRPSMIIGKICELLDVEILPSSFSIIDIACGDGLILKSIKNRFPASDCYGVDMNKGNVDTHLHIADYGVEIYRIPIQKLFSSRSDDDIFDISMMLNTYRGWGAARLRENELNLPEMATEWMSTNSRYSILTVDDRQKRDMSEIYRVEDIGQGEQDSRMILVDWLL